MDSFPILPASLSHPGTFGEEKQLKWWISLYFILLLLEGGLRKWILPFAATPLLVIRDPIVLVILYLAVKRGYAVLNSYTAIYLGVTIVSIFTALAFGHGNPAVALFGSRIFLLHVPLIFVIGQVLTLEDVEKIGRWILIASIPMCLLIIAQFYSPQSAFVNRGVGGSLAGAGFSGANGYFRPPATFSFTNGSTLFFSTATVFVLYFWQNYRGKVSKLILLGATVSVILALPFSISRSYVLQFGIALLFFLIASLSSPKSLGRLVVGLIVVTAVLIPLSQLEFAQIAIDAMSTRFTSAAAAEGDLVKSSIGQRLFGNLFRSVASVGTESFWGLGIGAGTNVGSQLLSGSVVFRAGEGEWDRVIGELGFLLGITIMLSRVVLTAHFSIKSIQYLRGGFMLPWLLTSFCAVQMVFLGWAQPTSLGFCVGVTGLLLASFNTHTVKK